VCLAEHSHVILVIIFRCNNSKWYIVRKPQYSSEVYYEPRVYIRHCWQWTSASFTHSSSCPLLKRGINVVPVCNTVAPVFTSPLMINHPLFYGHRSTYLVKISQFSYWDPWTQVLYTCCKARDQFLCYLKMYLWCA